jgi:hypothetical protein
MAVTLGAPKIGDDTFSRIAKELDPKIIRLSRINDPLTKLSPVCASFTVSILFASYDIIYDSYR